MNPRDTKALVPQAVRSEPLDKHVENLKYTAAYIAELMGREILRQMLDGKPKDASRIRNEAISFGIMVDKADKNVQGTSLVVNLPHDLIAGLRLEALTIQKPKVSATLSAETQLLNEKPALEGGLEPQKSIITPVCEVLTETEPKSTT